MSSHPAPTRALPHKPSLAQLRKQAKELLYSYRAGKLEAVVEVERFERSSDPALIGACDLYGVTPLHLAAWKHDPETVGWLLDHGASPGARATRSARCLSGREALQGPGLATLRGRDDAVVLGFSGSSLFQKGGLADPNPYDVATSGQFLVYALVRRGALGNDSM